MKEKLYKIAKLAISFMAILQLALSQVHIKVITKVFASDIGFYLFLFVLFGLVMTFSLSSMKRESNIVLYSAITTAALASGIIYLSMLFKDISTGTYLTIDVARLSIIVSIICLVIYGSGTAVIMLTRKWGSASGKYGKATQ